jgi:hypothetical protein
LPGHEVQGVPEATETARSSVRKDFPHVGSPPIIPTACALHSLRSATSLRRPAAQAAPHGLLAEPPWTRRPDATLARIRRGKDLKVELLIELSEIAFCRRGQKLARHGGQCPIATRCWPTRYVGSSRVSRIFPTASGLIHSTPVTQGEGPCRSCGRQRDRERITTQHHKDDQPPGRPLAVSVRPNQLSDVGDGLRFRPAALGDQRGAFGLQACQATGLPVRSSTSPARVQLAFHDGHCPGGPPSSRRLGDRSINLGNAAIKVGDGVGLSLDPLCKCRVLSLE